MKLLWIVGSAILIMALNVVISILYIAVYGYVINPGHPEQFYQDYARLAAPWCSIVGGMPLFFFGCRWVTARWETAFRVKAALLIWLVYALIDVTVLALGGFKPRLVILTLVSLATKFGAAYLGVSTASRSAQ